MKRAMILLLLLGACVDPPVVELPDAGLDPLPPGPDGGPVPGEDAGGPGCDDATLAVLAPEDRDRVALVAHRFNNAVSDLRALVLRADGSLEDTGVRLDVGFPVQRVQFAPNGELAVAVSEDGQAAVVEVKTAETMRVVSTVQLPAFGYGELVFSPDGTRVYAVAGNVTEEAGVDTLALSCDGTLSVLEGGHYGLRLADSIALLPGAQRAVVMGGQAVFEPIDDDDVRLVSLAGDVLAETAAFDLWGDFIDALRIDVSSDGAFVALPNGSPFSTEGGQVIVAAVAGESITLDTRVLDMGDAREAIFTPFDDVAVTRLEPGIVSLLGSSGAEWTEVDSETGVGLAEHIVFVERGPLRGRALVTSVSQEPQIVVLDFGPGTIDRVETVTLGPGSENIPGSITLAP